MDSAQTIILTSIVNIIITGLVGGIVIYAIQKKIDTTIQKYLFEYQTKFARNYPKILEILEKFNQKFQQYLAFCSQNGQEIELQFSQKESVAEQELIDFEIKNLKALDECHLYLRENRHFLPDTIIMELETILDRAYTLSTYIIDIIRLYPYDKESLLSWFSFDKTLEEDLLKDIDRLDARAPFVVISAIADELQKLPRRFERVYKSITEAQ